MTKTNKSKLIAGKKKKMKRWKNTKKTKQKLFKPGFKCYKIFRLENCTRGHKGKLTLEKGGPLNYNRWIWLDMCK